MKKNGSFMRAFIIKTIGGKFYIERERKQLCIYQ